MTSVSRATPIYVQKTLYRLSSLNKSLASIDYDFHEKGLDPVLEKLDRENGFER